MSANIRKESIVMLNLDRFGGTLLEGPHHTAGGNLAPLQEGVVRQPRNAYRMA